MKRVVLATFGSLGDLHPYMALARELQARGHHPIIATGENFRRRVEERGIEFHPLRPDFNPDDRENLARMMDEKRGSENIIRYALYPRIRETYADLVQISRTADLLVSHVVVFAGPVVAESIKIPWISSVLSPASLFSTYDPPLIRNSPFFTFLNGQGPIANRLLFRLARWGSRRWARPIDELRRELSLSRGDNPLFEGQHAPARVLALFSPLIGTPQPDWPPQARATGFSFYDEPEGGSGLSPETAHFLDSGPAPLVFTLGSAAVFAAGDFYAESASSAQELGMRAIFLVGTDPANRMSGPAPSTFHWSEYEPYSHLFPRAAAIVHQGGIGTTAQGMRAGRPMLIVPFSHDQPDNAARVGRLGIAPMVPRRAYTAARAAGEIRRLLEDSAYAQRASDIGRLIQEENGTKTAGDAIEELLP